MTRRKDTAVMAKREVAGDERLLTPAEVAARFRVDSKSVARWAKAGRLHELRTLGGHRRFYESEVNALQRGEPWVPPASVSQQAPPR